MIEEVIQVISTEQKQGAKGPYLEVTYRNEKGEERKRNIFDQTLWNLFGEGLWVKWQIEKEGNWWNVKGAESVKEGLEKVAESKQEKPSEPAPQPVGQEIGMTTKELGDMIRAERLMPIFGLEAGAELVQWYRSRILGTTRVPFDGTKLPKIKTEKEE